MATKFLSYPFRNENIDALFGLNNKNTEKKFKIGDKFVTFDGNDVIVGGNKYEGTPGFWSLIVSENPGPDDYTVDDLEKYRDLLIRTNAIFLITIQPRIEQRVIFKGLNGKTLLNLFGKILNPNQQEREEREEREERNDKKTPPLQQVAPVLRFSQTTLTH